MCWRSCKRELTFGELLSAWLKSGSTLSRAPIPHGLLSEVFARIAAKPLCSLYAPADAPGFVGHCDTTLPKACSNPDR